MRIIKLRQEFKEGLPYPAIYEAYITSCATELFLINHNQSGYVKWWDREALSYLLDGQFKWFEFRKLKTCRAITGVFERHNFNLDRRVTAALTLDLRTYNEATFLTDLEDCLRDCLAEQWLKRHDQTLLRGCTKIFGKGSNE